MRKTIVFLFALIASFSAHGEVWQARYGVAETFDFKLYNADGTLDVDEADGGTEVSVSCNEGAETTATNDFVDEGTFYSIALTATEMQCERITVVVAATTTEVFFVQTSANASAMTPSYEANVGTITDGAIAAADFATGAITATVIAADAITSSEIADGAIDAAALATDTITAAKIAADSIAASEIAADAIGAAEIANAAIDAATFASAAIDATAIATDAIGAAELATDAIGAAELAADAIGASELATGAITTAEFASGAIDAAAIATDAIGAAEIAANAIAAAEVADGAIDEATFATTAGSFDALGIIDQGTAQAATSTTLQLRSAATFADDEIIGATCLITGGSAGVGQSRPVTDFVSSSDTATVSTWTTTPTGTITYECFGTSAGGGSVSIAAGGITTSSFASGAIDAAAIAADAIGSSELATDAIGAAEIATDAIGANELAASAIGASELADGGITSAEFGSGAITATVIAADAITSSEIADGAIDAGALATDTITAAKIAADAIGAAEVANTTIDAATFAAGAVDASAIATDAIGNAELASDAGAGLSSIPWNASWDAEVQSEATDALAAIYLDQLLANTYDPASPPGATDSLLEDLVESDGGVTRFSVNALEQGPSGGGGVADWTADERTAIRAILGIPGSGTTPADPSAGILDTIRDYIDTEIGTLVTNIGTPTNLGSGASLAANSVDVESQTDDIGAAGAGLTAADDAVMTRLGAPAGASVSADIAAVEDQTDDIGVAGAGLSAADDAVMSRLGTPAGASVSDDIAAVEGQTDDIGVAGAGLTAIDDAVLAAIAALNNLSPTQVRDLVIEDQGGGITLGCALAAKLAVLAGDVTTTGGNSTFEDPSGTETRVTTVVVSNGNRTATITCPTY